MIINNIKDEIIYFTLRTINSFININKGKKISISNITEQIFYHIDKHYWHTLYYYNIILVLFLYNLINRHKYINFKELKNFLNKKIEEYIKDTFGCKSLYTIQTTISKKTNTYKILEFINKENLPIKIIKNHSIEVNQLRSRFEIINNSIIKIS